MDTARKREGRLMSAISWVRNTLILGGIGAGALIAVHAYLSKPPASAADPAARPAAVMLNTARLVPAAPVNLGRPLSLESAFGRSEITGRQVFSVPPDPLFELNIVRDYDTAPGRMPPLPAIDMQPRRAEDEIAPGDDETGPAAIAGESEFADLPAAARESAQSGRKEMLAGNELMHNGLAILRGDKRATSLDEADRNLAGARKHFEAARDHLREALAYVPEHQGLLDLIQEAKTNMYTCAKHGRRR